MWILILVITVVNGGGITNVANFKTEQSCIAAGEKSQKDINIFGKNIAYSCIKQ